MKNNILYYDSIVIGAGPAGLFSALELLKKNKNIAVIEKGGQFIESLCPSIRKNLNTFPLDEAEVFRKECNLCNCLNGIGGAAFHFGSNLGYFGKFSASKVELDSNGNPVKFSKLERVLGSFQRAEELINYVNNQIIHYGYKPKNYLYDSPVNVDNKEFDHIDFAPSQHISLSEAYDLINNIVNDIISSEGKIYTYTQIHDIKKGSLKKWQLRGMDNKTNTEVIFETNNIIISVGKISLPWVIKVINDLKIDYNNSKKCDIGVRIETSRNELKEFLRYSPNPKLSFINKYEDVVRTFCVCDGGRVMKYRLGDAIILDGQHKNSSETNNINFGILTTIQSNEISGTDFSLNYAKKINKGAENNVLLQRLEDFILNRSTTTLKDNKVIPTLKDFTLGNLNNFLDTRIRDNILSMIDKINKINKKDITNDTLIIAPVIESIYPDIILSENMETSQEGVYFVGDCSSKVIGITYAGATGIAAAQNINRLL
ncbi:MAG: hypothetical protein A2Y34_08830 [Spirochaetes bacterium GWC1_27_15]|nr:MAG: hypothetical protein A2Y34_08830 [Spirochaetes bacterium GWC1_27_15]